MSDLPRDILLFVAAYEERSFTAAAAREGATQSGVSQHIRKLEERFGARLFSRDGGRVEPTPAAESYYLRCLEILRAHAVAGDALRDFGIGLSGDVLVGLMPTMTRCVLAPSLDRFNRQHPNVTVRVTEDYSGALTDRVRGGALHFAVVPAFSDLAGLTSQAMATTPEVLVSGPGSGRQHGKKLRAGDLGRLRLVLPGRRNTRRQSIEAYLQSNRVAVDQVLELDSMFATLDLVATTDWVTILPGVMMASDAAPGGFVVNPLDDPPLTLELVVIEASRNTLPPQVVAFRAALREQMASLTAIWS